VSSPDQHDRGARSRSGSARHADPRPEFYDTTITGIRLRAIGYHHDYFPIMCALHFLMSSPPDLGHPATVGLTRANDAYRFGCAFLIALVALEPNLHTGEIKVHDGRGVGSPPLLGKCELRTHETRRHWLQGQSSSLLA
jgi:hypothetical protein